MNSCIVRSESQKRTIITNIETANKIIKLDDLSADIIAKISAQLGTDNQKLRVNKNLDEKIRHHFSKVKIDVSRCEPTEVGFDFDRFPSLKIFEAKLSNDAFFPLNFFPVGDKHTNLVSVDIDSSEFGDEFLSQLSHQPNLRNLAIGDNWNITERGLHVFLKVNRNLESLRLGTTSIEHLYQCYRGKLDNLKSLEIIDNLNFSSRSVETLLSATPNLVELYLRCAHQLCDCSFECVASRKIEILDLYLFQDFENIKDSRCDKSLSNFLLNCPKLKKLRLINSIDELIPEDSLRTRKFSNFAFNALEELKLSNRELTFEGLTRFLNCAPNIKVLNLDCGSQYPEEANIITGLEKLESLSLRRPSPNVLSSLLENLTNLKSLTLHSGGRNLTLENLPSNQLTRLYLGSEYFEDKDVVPLITKSKNLRSVGFVGYLTHHSLDALPSNLLEFESYMPRIKTEDLYRTVRRQVTLESLTIGNVCLEFSVWKVMLDNCHSLKKLDLSYCNMKKNEKDELHNLVNKRNREF